MLQSLIGPNFIFYVITIPISLVLHEYAHARTADWLGDRTARLAGRLTLNPLVHLDPLGLLMILFGPIGWAKPIPITISNFRRPKLGMILTAAAGPISNLIIAAAAMLVLRFTVAYDSQFIFLLLQWFVAINIFLFIFNLIPIPPLDGSRILSGLLPYSAAVKYSKLELYGPFILLLVVIIGPLRNHLLYPLFTSALKLFTGLFGYSIW